ncbi:hypothetical protein DFR78_11026 [Halanaerobium sp. MA284_MarDTE_T2]|nr:hypothetical protein DFR78_11026 [Halanaerobium sp. MA284_MarDTE_T2]
METLKIKSTSYNMGLKVPLRSMQIYSARASHPRPHKLLKSQGRYMKPQLMLK